MAKQYVLTLNEDQLCALGNAFVYGASAALEANREIGISIFLLSSDVKKQLGVDPTEMAFDKHVYDRHVESTRKGKKG